MAKAKAAGSFFGAIFGNPIVALLLLGLGALLIFRKDITNFLDKGIGNITLPEIKLPDITLPDITLPDIPNPFEDFKFPDFSGFFTGLQEQQENFFTKLINQFNLDVSPDIPKPIKMVEDTGLLSQEDVLKCECGSTITQDAFGNVQQLCKVCDKPPSAVTPPQDLGGIFGTGLLDFLGLTPAQEFAISKGGFNVPESNPFGIGGGGSFIGGTTTFGDSSNIVDTLSEVLNIFPNLTASQAADALAQNVGLTANEFAQVDPDIINISSAGFDPEQIFNNASGGFSGLTPQQIAFILTGGNISNF